MVKKFSKKYDRNEWIDWEDFKEALIALRQPSQSFPSQDLNTSNKLNRILKLDSINDLNTCTRPLKKKAFGFGKKSS